MGESKMRTREEIEAEIKRYSLPIYEDIKIEILLDIRNIISGVNK